MLQWRGEINVDHLYLPPPDHTPVVREAESRNSVSVSSSFRSTSTDCMDVFRSSSSSLFPLHDGWAGGNDLVSNPKICITTTTSADLEQLLQWIFYHKVIGVSSFFIFVEGTAAKKSTSSVLEAIPGVKVIYRTKDLVKKQAASRIWNETWFSEFLYKPCNYQSFSSQSLNMETATVMARDAGINWIIHLDTDELIHPAGSYEYSLMQMLSDVPSNIDMLVFPTYESIIQRDDIVEPFTEVSLFKRSYDHLPRDMFYGFRKEASHGNSDYFLTYANGKSAVRIQDHLIPNGPYRWQNYLKALNEIKLEEGAILHYTYTKFSDLTSKRDKCSCKPNREDAKRCFMLNFDRDAFIVASTATEKEKLRWFHEHVVWKDKELIVKLLKNNIMTHITAPMAIIKALRDSGVFAAAVESANIASNSKISN